MYKLIIKKTLILVCFVCFTIISIVAQNLTSNPMSYYGIGEYQRVSHSVLGGLGNASEAYVDSTFLNIYNPASYAFLAKGQPLFSTGLGTRISNYQENGNSSLSSVTQMTHFALGVPFGKRFGLVMGIKPYAKKGYDFIDENTFSTDTIINRYYGSGSINESFLGFSVAILNQTNRKLSVGLNGSYLFGKVIDARSSRLSSTLSGGIEESSLELKGIHSNFGLYFEETFAKGNSFSLAYIIDPSQKMNAFSTLDLYQSVDITDVNYFYRLDSTGSIQGEMNSPLRMTIAGSYKFRFNDANKKDGYLKKSEIALNGSFNFVDYSNYSLTTDNYSDLTSYVNTQKIALGVQYTPEVQFLSAAMNTTMMQRMRYRVGGYFGALPIQLNSNTLNDLGVTAGFGIPIKIQKSLTSFNLSFGYGVRKSNNPASFSEHYFSINAGIIIAPANFEKWFVKRKYD